MGHLWMVFRMGMEGGGAGRGEMGERGNSNMERRRYACQEWCLNCSLEAPLVEDVQFALVRNNIKW